MTVLPLPRLNLASLASAALALSAWALVPAVPAFAAPTTSGTPSAQAPSEFKTTRYLLHLEDGRVLRGTARMTDGVWEIKRGREWQALPAGFVARAVAEKEVLAEARRMRKATDREDAAQRVALATWMFDQGLQAEAATELDAVLTIEPDQPQALALIAKAGFPANLPRRAADIDEPAWRAELITFGAKATPMGRELVTVELTQLDDMEALREALRAQLGEGSDRRRSFATVALRRLFPGREIRPLLQSAVLDSSEDVRRGAAVALRGAGDAGVIIPVVKALESDSPAVRTNAAQALGYVGHAAAVEPLMLSLLSMAQSRVGARRIPHSNIFVGKQLAYIQDFNVEVAQRQAVADPQINVLIPGSVLDAGVHSVREYVSTHEKRVTRASLRRLTGANPGDRIEDWRQWWEENKDSWRSSDLSRPPTTGPRTGQADTVPESSEQFTYCPDNELIRPRPVTRFGGEQQ
jgi:HEAT repeat protein